jgi:hypothetical protein
MRTTTSVERTRLAHAVNFTELYPCFLRTWRRNLPPEALAGAATLIKEESQCLAQS